MDARSLSDADARYLARVVEDVRGLLGPGVVLEAALDRDRLITIRLRHSFGGVEVVSEGIGDTLLAAHANLRERLVEDRVGIGLKALLASH